MLTEGISRLWCVSFYFTEFLHVSMSPFLISYLFREVDGGGIFTAGLSSATKPFSATATDTLCDSNGVALCDSNVAPLCDCELSMTWRSVVPI